MHALTRSNITRAKKRNSEYNRNRGQKYQQKVEAVKKRLATLPKNQPRVIHVGWSETRVAICMQVHAIALSTCSSHVYRPVKFSSLAGAVFPLVSAVRPFPCGCLKSQSLSLRTKILCCLLPDFLAITTR